MATILADLMLRLRSNSAELQKGVETSKKSVNSYSKTVSKTNKETSSSFSKLKKGATGSLGAISKSLSGMGSAAGGSVSGISSMTGAVGSLNMALGPLGIIIAAIGLAVAALKSYFTNTTEGANKFAKIMGYLEGVMAVFTDILADVGKWLVKAFEDPKTAVSDLWTAIKENLVNRFQGMVEMFSNAFKSIKNGFLGVANSIKGLFDDEAQKKADEYFAKMQQNLKDTGKSAVQMMTGFTVEDIAKKTTSLLDKINKKAKEGEEIGDRKHKLEMATIQLIKTEADARAKVAKLLLKSKDQEKATLQERKTALETAMKVEAKVAKEKVRLAKEAYDIKVAENKLGYSGPEALKEEANLYKELKSAEEERDTRLRRVQNRLNEINNKIIQYGEDYVNMTEVEARANNKRMAEQKKKEAELQKEKLRQQAERIAKERKAEESLQSWRESQLMKSEAGELQLLQDKFKKGLILREEYEGRKAEIIKKWAEINAQVSAENWQAQFDDAIYWGDQVQQYVGGLLNAVAGMWEVSKQRELKAAGDNAKKKEEIEKRYARKQKGVAIAQAMINGALGVTKAFAQLGPIAGAIAAGLVLATTAAQIAVINQQKFAKGGIVSGPTNALVGEYPNAKSNPEVIAPLSDLRSILAQTLTKDLFKPGNIGTGRIGNKSGKSEVTFTILGEDLVAVLDKQTLKSNIY